MEDTTVPAVQNENRIREHPKETDPLDVLIQEFGQEAGKRVGRALAEEIHNDPDARHAAATGAGLGIGVAVGLGLLILATQ